MQQRLRSVAGLSDLGHVLVNDSGKLVDYRTSILWLSGKSKGSVAAVSGIPQTVKDAPFTVWVRQLCRYAEKKAVQEPFCFSANDVPGEIACDWREYLPAHAI
ncbi:MAG: secretion protein HylD, partial [Desulfobacterales bacterium]|nr:secretion protein HylD [Desulfobacterales bacterium]